MKMYLWQRSDTIGISIQMQSRKIGANKRDVSRLCCCLVPFYIETTFRFVHDPIIYQLSIPFLPLTSMTNGKTGMKYILINIFT